MTLKPAWPRAAPMRRARAYSGSVTGVRAEPKTDTAGGMAAMMRKPRSSSSDMRRTRSASVRTCATAGVSALSSSSSEVAGARGSITGGDDTDAAWTAARVDNLRMMADDERTSPEPDAQPTPSDATAPDEPAAEADTPAARPPAAATPPERERAGSEAAAAPEPPPTAAAPAQ